MKVLRIALLVILAAAPVASRATEPARPHATKRLGQTVDRLRKAASARAGGDLHVLYNTLADVSRTTVERAARVADRQRLA